MSASDSTPTIEEWRDIPGHPGYQVSDCGQVRSRWMHGPGEKLSEVWHPVKPKPTREGHLQVRLRRVGHYVHRLVLLAFVGPCPEGLIGLHNNDNPKDNRLVNLSWGTRKQNVADRFRNKGVVLEDNLFVEKLTQSEKQKAWFLRKHEGLSYQEIGRRFGVTRQLVARAVRAVVDEGGMVPQEVK